MIDVWRQFQFVLNQVVENPANLIYLVILFLIGRYIGLLTKNIKTWKVVLLFCFSVFLYDPISNSGPILGGIFFAGMASHHSRNFLSILSWAGSFKDVVFASRYRAAYEDVRRRERELDEREERLREEERRQAHSSQGQRHGNGAGWQQDAKNFRQGQKEGGSYKAREKTSSGSKDPNPQYDDDMSKRLRALGLTTGKNYTNNEIKKAYRKAAMKTHPDAGGTEIEFIKVQEAYKALYDAGKH